MHSARAEVRLLLSEGDPWSQVWPEQAVADGSPVMVGVRHAGTAVGEIEVDIADADESDRDRMLLDDLARPAGLALSTVRLTVELRRRAVDLEALTAALAESYQRIADARRTEIARMREEMQDRVMPHLDRAEQAIARELGDTEVAAAANGASGAAGNGSPGAAGSLIERARLDVAEALESLRILARGIYPPRLADAGLAVSLEGWQQRSGVGVDVQVRGDEAALRENSELESCLYFCLVTALGAVKTDGVRPAAVVDIGPSGVGLVVGGAVEGGSLVDGPAMTAVRDRVEAFGGRLDISAADGGLAADDPVKATVTVHAWIPLAEATGR
jgi:signal transduction histidine kinase